MCCAGGHRTFLNESGGDYWFGLYKLTPTPDGTTAWYDGNPSTFREWPSGQPDEYTACVRYRKKGFSDRLCSLVYYYTCKKVAGNFCAIVTYLDNVGLFFTLFTSYGNKLMALKLIGLSRAVASLQKAEGHQRWVEGHGVSK